MTYFIAGLIALIVFSGALNKFLGTNPKWLSTQLRRVGGGALVAFALFLLTRGQFELAIPVAIGGMTLMGWTPGALGGWGGGSTAKPAGQTSTVRSASLEMVLDHDSGVMRGRFVDGPLKGRDLDQIPVDRLVQAFADIDGESISLLEAYLDRRQPLWRDDLKGHASTGQGASAMSSAMSEQEAHEILGLSPGASEQAIREAHRSLMKKLHPDQGGSTWLATRVNMAKDLLLSGQRRNS
ncbi:MAG: DnaJ domain-containing protein [Alphaproteobacteria bacterium]|jgi:hypothetical protein